MSVREGRSQIVTRNRKLLCDREIDTHKLVAMLRSPVGEAASAEAIARCLQGRIEGLLTATIASQTIIEETRDLLYEAVFDPASPLYDVICADFSSGFSRCVERARYLVRKRSRRYKPYDLGYEDLPDPASTQSLLRGVFLRRAVQRNLVRDKIVVLRLQGYSIDEIIPRVGLCRSTVIAILGDIRRHGL